ncbi:isochorismatase [Xylariaceae sp. AK1471]|nr:isochorismatase [Xylariaceae sp. AK1471]
MSSIIFGPPGNEWKYKPDAKLYDLTRDTSLTTMSFATSRGTPEVSVAIAPECTALVVIDMQNYFLHPSCNHHPTGIAAADRVLEVVKKCREAQIKVIWLSWGLAEDDLTTMPAASVHSFADGFVSPPLDSTQPHCSFGCGLGNNKGRMLMNGSWNAQLYDPLHQAVEHDNDLIIAKNRVSGFWNGKTAFAKALEEWHIRTLLFTGVNTNQCVLGTLLDAYYRGYDCLLIEDCCATKTPGGQDVPILDISRGYGFVTDSSAFRQAKFHVMSQQSGSSAGNT